MIGTTELRSYLPNNVLTDFLMKSQQDVFVENGDIRKKIAYRRYLREMSRDLYQNIAAEIVKIENNGPANNLRIADIDDNEMFDCDFLLAFVTKQWPAAAWQEWRSRDRAWPVPLLVEFIATLPCHVMAKSRDGVEDQSWRFSFSQSENALLALMPQLAKRCFLRYMF